MQINRVKDRNGNVVAVVDHEFIGIENIQRSLESMEIGVLCGSTALEEYASFLRRKRLPNFRYVAGGAGISIRSLVERSGLMYARDRYRVDRFISKEYPYWKPDELFFSQNTFKNIFEFCQSNSWEDVRSYLLHEYIDTRRVKAGAETEFRTYFRPLDRLNIDGNLIINISGGWRYEDMVAIARWRNSQNPGSLLVISQYENRWLRSPQVKIRSEGSYLDLLALMRCVQSYYELTEQATQAAFRIWRKTLNSVDQGYVDAGKISRSLASRFAEALNESDFRADFGTDSALPGQKPAPLRFKSENGSLDILSSREHSPEEARVVGGARTCLSAVDDLLDYAGFANAIPNFQRRVRRVSEALTEVIDSHYDDALIVQIGTEVGALEARVWASKDQLGEMAFGEASAFFATLYGFLSQFNCWTEYRASLSTLPMGKEEGAFSTAKEVLADVTDTPAAATPNAISRITDFMSGLDGNGASPVVQKEGLILSAENAASQGAARLVEIAKEQGAELGLEFVEEVRTKMSSGLASWFILNLPKLRFLANAKNIEWLLSFIDKLTS